MSLNKHKTSRTSLIDLNEPKISIYPKYIQIDSIRAPNGPNWAQMTKLKWDEKSLNELKWLSLNEIKRA